MTLYQEILDFQIITSMEINFFEKLVDISFHSA